MTDKNKVVNEMRCVAKDLIGRTEELCELDRFVGDGDHGITIKHGFNKVLLYLEQPASTIEEVFTHCADAVLEGMGGAIGPIFASVFMGLAMESSGKEEITRNDWEEMLKKARDVVMVTGEAKPGERTLVDTLEAAVMAFEEARDEADRAAWKLILDRTKEGAQNTRKMQARKGRARYLAEKSIGYVDAGAMTMYYFIRQIAMQEMYDNSNA